MRAANEPRSLAPRRGRAAAHPDQLAAAAQITDELAGALGVDVTVRPRGKGFRVELTFEDLYRQIAEQIWNPENLLPEVHG